MRRITVQILFDEDLRRITDFVGGNQVPLGVLGIIFEARPDAAVQATKSSRIYLLSKWATMNIFFWNLVRLIIYDDSCSEPHTYSLITSFEWVLSLRSYQCCRSHLWASSPATACYLSESRVENCSFMIECVLSERWMSGAAKRQCRLAA